MARRIPIPERWGAWLLRLGLLALLVVLFFNTWTLIWHLALLPRARTAQEGLYAVRFGQENLKGPIQATGLVPSAELTLKKEHTSVEARGVWLVPQAGLYRLRIECDDYGQIKVDGREVVAVHGYKADNRGEGQVFLTAGSHLIVIELNNGINLGWLKVSYAPPGSSEFSPLPSVQLCPLPVNDLAFWLNLVEATRRPVFRVMSLLVVLLLFMLTLPGRREDGLARTLVRNLINLGLLLIGCLVALALAELVVRWLEPVEMRVRGNQIQLTKNHRVEITQNKCDKFPAHLVHTKNNLGFRGAPPPKDFNSHLTMVCVGGSTTECYYLDDNQTWPQMLQNSLSSHFSKLWVNNAGLDGHSTRGHLYLVKDYLAPIKPKVVLFLVGLNDVGRDQMSKYDAWLVDMAQGKAGEPSPSFWQRISDQGLLETMADYSHLAAILMTVERAQTAAQGGLSHGCTGFERLPEEKVEPGREAAMLAKHQQRALPAYGNRLRQLVSLTRKAGMEPVLITQPAMWGEGVDPTTGRRIELLSTKNLEGEPGWNAGSMWRLLEMYNDQTRQVGKEMGVWVVDLARQMPKDSALFYDWAHFTAQGARKVAEIISQDICPLLARRYASWVRKPCGAASGKIPSDKP